MSSAVKVYKHFEAPKEEGIYYRLVCLTGKNKGEAYFLIGKRVVLGRSDKVDIRVLDIKSSREHAEIIQVGKDFVLTDLGSQNGIVVNDLKIKQHVLNEGDKIIIGQTVYKFGRIEVKPKIDKKALKLQETQEDNEIEEEITPKKGGKSTFLLGILAVGGIALLLLSGEEQKADSKKSKAKYKINEMAGVSAVSMQGERKRDKNVQERMNIYFQKGLREFREGNYFRAISEFEHALAWSPSDPQAQFYLRKTQEALDKMIDELMLKGKRDEESLKLQSAAVSYCQILRLLYRYPDDQRHKDAKEFLKKVEGSLGLEEGQMECTQEIK
jgi:pSer/pThr/pTyr-binding forkhead associated (FHA) protein